MKAIDGDILKEKLDDIEDTLDGDDGYTFILKSMLKTIRRIINDMPTLRTPMDYLDDGR